MPALCRYMTVCSPYMLKKTSWGLGKTPHSQLGKTPQFRMGDARHLAEQATSHAPGGLPQNDNFTSASAEEVLCLLHCSFYY